MNSLLLSTTHAADPFAFTSTTRPRPNVENLVEHINTANNSAGRQGIYRAFIALKHTPGLSVGERFARLLEIRNQLIATPEAIADSMLRSHIFSTLPDSFSVTIGVLEA